MLKAKLRNKKAPRFRKSKFRYTVLNRELHKNYMEKNPDGIQDYLLFKAIIEDFNTIVSEEVVYNRDGVKLPALMGMMALCSFRPRRLVPLDWLKIDETGLRVKNFNFETDGLVCKIVYSSYSSKYKFRHRNLWRFKAHRSFKTLASKTFKKQYNIYKSMEKEKVSKIFRDDYCTTNFFSKRNEQGVDGGQSDNGPVHIP